MWKLIAKCLGWRNVSHFLVEVWHPQYVVVFRGANAWQAAVRFHVCTWWASRNLGT